MTNISCLMGGVVRREVLTGLPLLDPPWNMIVCFIEQRWWIYLEECSSIFHLLLMNCILWLFRCLVSHLWLNWPKTVCVGYLHPFENWLHSFQLVLQDNTCKHLGSSCFATGRQNGLELDTELVLRVIIFQSYKLKQDLSLWFTCELNSLNVTWGVVSTSTVMCGNLKVWKGRGEGDAERSS